MGFFDKKNSNNNSQRNMPTPPIKNEKDFIEWMLRNDEELEMFRALIPKKNIDLVVNSTVKEIMRELSEFPNGIALMNKLGVIGEYYQSTLMPMINDRGGIQSLPSCPEEIIIVFLSCITKFTILPYFIYYKYGKNLPLDIFPLKDLWK